MARPRSAALNAPRFIAVLARCGNVSTAARAAGLSRSRAYELRREDPAFAADWQDALHEATDAIAWEARRRALQGVARPVFYQGRQVGEWRQYSDRLLQFLLRAYRPEVYGPCRRLREEPPDSTAPDPTDDSTDDPRESR